MIQSKASLSKQARTQGTFFSLDTGNPIYTIKDGGTLKKKLQPMAADRQPRIPVAGRKEVTAPGSYDLPGNIGGA